MGTVIRFSLPQRLCFPYVVDSENRMTVPIFVAKDFHHGLLA